MSNLIEAAAVNAVGQIEMVGYSAHLSAGSEIFGAALSGCILACLPAGVEGSGKRGKRTGRHFTRADRPHLNDLPCPALFPGQPAARKGDVVKMRREVNPDHRDVLP